MMSDMTRRDFLEATAAAGGLMMVGGLWPDAAVAQASGLQPAAAMPVAERVVVTVVTDNLADATRPNFKVAKRPAGGKSPVDSAMHAEHGLAYYVETTVESKPHAFMFDFGTQAPGLQRNLDFLKIDFRKIEAMAISHDHWDHEAAAIELLQAKRADLARSVPLYLGQGFFAGTYAKRATGEVQLLSVLNRDDVERLGFVRIVEVTTPTAIVPGAWLTGTVPQITEYERVAPNFMAKKGDQFVQEDFVGEQSVVMNVRGKGLVIVTACSHRGVVNIVKHAQRITGVERIHAIIGGLHLTGARPELIASTVADLKAIKPDWIVPTHCTGFEAMNVFAREMPEQFILNTAGTRYTFEA
jgi:7,8-dihydropterin-6-yl-methyl-4-(beta-D-ribofuranosyl)aminobenzene 5'-phosphate synthase